MTMTSTLRDQALSYSARGWSVFPVCTPIPQKEHWCLQHGDHRAENARRLKNGAQPLADPGKHPLVNWRQFQDRLSTTGEITSWWKKWPDANIGVVTGAVSGVVVLDADGFDAYTAVLSHEGSPDTPTALTGKPSGYHWYFEHPGKPVRNFAGHRGVPGLDFRGDGGYAVLPPSLHRAGINYRWQDNSDFLVPAPLPAWLLDLLLAGPSTGATPDELSHDTGQHLDLEAILNGISEGTRDDTIWRLASRLRGDNVTLDLAQFIIRQVARACSPPFDEAIALEKVTRAYREFTPNIVLGGTRHDDDPGEQDEPFTPYPIMDFLAKQLPRLEWLVPGYLQEQGIAFCYGNSGTLKTYILTDLALSLAAGIPFLGQFQTRQTRVLVIQQDTPEALYQQAYLRPMVEGRQLSAGDLDGNMFVATDASVFRLDLADRVKALEVWIEQYRPGWIMLDAFYLMHSTDGLTMKDLVPVMAVLRRLRREYGCGFGVVDHDRKSSTTHDTTGDPIDDLYGGRAKGAASEALWQTLRVKGEPACTYLHVRKLRGALLPEPVRLRLQDGVVRIDGTSADTLAGASKDLHEWLLREGGSRSKKQMQRGVNLAERTVHQAVGDLFTRGLIRQTGKAGRELMWMGLNAVAPEPGTVGQTSE